MEYYSAKREEILSFALTWIKLEGDMLSRVIERERERDVIDDLISIYIEEQSKGMDSI